MRLTIASEGWQEMTLDRVENKQGRQGGHYFAWQAVVCRGLMQKATE